MHSIEYDGSEPHPWKITTDDGAEWHAAAETEAALELAAFIIGSELRPSPPCQPCPRGRC